MLELGGARVNENKQHCDFCEFLSCMKKVDKSEINWRQGEKPMYKAALVHGYRRRGKNIGTMTHGTFDLNFCPVCGTKLEEE